MYALVWAFLWHLELMSRYYLVGSKVISKLSQGPDFAAEPITNELKSQAASLA